MERGCWTVSVLNESISWNMQIKEGEDVSIALSFNPRPFGDAVDNLDLIVSYGEENRVHLTSLEATEVVKIPSEDLVGISSIQRFCSGICCWSSCSWLVWNCRKCW